MAKKSPGCTFLEAKDQMGQGKRLECLLGSDWVVAVGKSSSNVVMVKPAENRLRKNASYRLDHARYWRVLVQSQVSTRFVVIIHVRMQNVAQVSFTKDDDMIKAFSSDRADQSFRSPCHGDRGIVGRSRIPMADSRRLKYAP
jgi:hypothetical protein